MEHASVAIVALDSFVRRTSALSRVTVILQTQTLILRSQRISPLQTYHASTATSCSNVLAALKCWSMGNPRLVVEMGIVVGLFRHTWAGDCLFGRFKPRTQATLRGPRNPAVMIAS
jgi:hypothetical protein